MWITEDWSPFDRNTQFCIFSSQTVYAILHIRGWSDIVGIWRIMEYVSARGENPMKDWYDQQPIPVQARCDATLLILAGTSDWEHPKIDQFKALSGRHAGLGEVCFDIKANAPGSKNPISTRFRPAGIWPSRVPNEFILLLGCSKSGRGTYTPHRAFDIALG